MSRASLTFILGCALLSGGVLYVGCGSDEEAPAEPALEPEYEDSAPPDLCEPISGEVCATFPQCGCGKDENCNVVAASGRTACVPTGSRALHETCVNVGECAVGLQCFGGVCVPLCLEDPDCTLATARCKRVTFTPAPEADAAPGEDTGQPETGGDAVSDAPQADTRPRGIEIPGYSVCLAQCDPMNPAAVCGAGHACVFFAPGDDTTQCITPGTATGAGGCKKSALACAAGYGCFEGDCRKLCRVGMAGDCTAGACTAFPEPLTKGGVQYGTCK